MRRTTKARGIVRSFQTNPAGSALNSPWAGTVHVWTFQLERQLPSGEPADPIAVEMRGPMFEGFVRDGHDVEVTGIIVNGTLQARSAVNYSTGPSVVRPRGGSLRRTAIGIGLTAVMVFGVLALVMQTGLWTVFQRQIGRSAIVQLDGCIIETKGGSLFFDLFAGPPRVGELPPNVIARRYEALRRADLWFGSVVEFEVEYDGAVGWLSGQYITGLEGNCGSNTSEVPAASNSSIVNIEEFEQFQELFPDVSKHILLNSTVLEDCAVEINGAGGINFDNLLYLEPSLVLPGSEKVIHRLDNWFEALYPAYLHYEDGRNWYFTRMDGRWGWILFDNSADELDCFKLTVEDIQSDHVDPGSRFNVVDLESCIVTTSGGVLGTRDPNTGNWITFASLPPIEMEYQALRGAGARIIGEVRNSRGYVDPRELGDFEIRYGNKVGWLSDLSVEVGEGDCGRIYSEAFVYESVYHFGNGTISGS